MATPKSPHVPWLYSFAGETGQVRLLPQDVLLTSQQYSFLPLGLLLSQTLPPDRLLFRSFKLLEVLLPNKFRLCSLIPFLGGKLPLERVVKLPGKRKLVPILNLAPLVRKPELLYLPLQGRHLLHKSFVLLLHMPVHLVLFVQAGFEVLLCLLKVRLQSFELELQRIYFRFESSALYLSISCLVLKRLLKVIELRLGLFDLLFKETASFFLLLGGFFQVQFQT